jgi:peptidoglycan/xylan/chitin deacetylase (PgdA/CDA1 family)
MIKNTAKNISNLGATVYSLDSLIKKTNHRLILPFYHVVSDENPIHIKNLYKPRCIKQFKEDLDFLLENYKSISLEELIEINQSNKTIAKNCFHLTFDDGLKEFYTVVAPILKERNVHATVFLNSDFIDNKKMFFRFKASILFEKLKNENTLSITYNNKEELDRIALENKIDFDTYLKKHQPYLTSDQIKELIDDGFTFGAHSKDHPLYKGLDIEEQAIQTKDSIQIVATQFNLGYNIFSFPFTDDGVGLELFNQIEEFTDLTFGCAGLKDDSARHHLQRIPMETNKTAKEIIKSEYAYCLMKQKAGKNKIERR